MTGIIVFVVIFVVVDTVINIVSEAKRLVDKAWKETVYTGCTKEELIEGIERYRKQVELMKERDNELIPLTCDDGTIIYKKWKDIDFDEVDITFD